MRGSIYILYKYETEETVALCEGMQEVQRYLNCKNLNTARSLVSHFLRGDTTYIRDEKNRRYTVARIKE